ncbi:MAG: L-aspartate oxidase [Phycisphaerales bacterium]|nr:L-aspartate oxidase [Phycisphaerales bacterium]
MERVFNDRRYLIPFRSTLLPQIFTDVLVVGGGVAGLRSAIAAASADADVIVLSKTDLTQTNTAWAQGGIASVMEAEDTFEAHVEDTLVAGAGLCDEPVVRLVVEQGPDRLRECLDWGMQLDRTAGGALAVGREGGHSARRIYHSGGDATGAELQRCLTAKARSVPNIRIFEKCFLLDLLTPSDDAGAPVLGAITHHPKFGLQVIWARSTILASGGAGMVYRETTNPHAATGDGLAAAYRAGVETADMAFMQFHPTVLYLPGAARSLISEAVRGEGAYLLDASGRRFMLDVHELAELAPRDIVSRAIVRQIASQGGQQVWLDCRHLKGFRERFPGISALLERFDLNPGQDLIPVHPAAHYTIGGVRTDAVGHTNVPGLYAVGEASCSGLHGANRLASNSLLEGLVFGEIAGLAAAKNGEATGKPTKLVSDIRPSMHGEIDLSDIRSSLRSAMWRNVGIERAGEKLLDAVEMFDFWGRYTLDKIFDDPAGWETQNLLLIGALMARSALWREESRGCHTREDFREARDAFHVHDCWRRGRGEPEARPVETPVARGDAS